MPRIVGTFATAGGVIGIDRRGRLAGLDLLAGEAIREVNFTCKFRTGLTGASSPAPPSFMHCILGVAFGVDPSSPPDFDPRTSPLGSDWLVVRGCNNIILPRPTTTTNNGWELEMSYQTDGFVPCPRPPVTDTTSIWLVCNPLSSPALGAPDWVMDAYFAYRTIGA